MSSDICKRTLCVKNLSHSSDRIINSLFDSFGKTSHKLIASTENNKKDIIVKFESEELARQARDAVHGKSFDGNNLFVDYARSEQPSRTSSSKSNQNSKVSVLDRIIKPGDPKYPKSDERGAANDKQNNQRDNLITESNDHVVSSSGKVLQHKTDKLDKSEHPSQLTVVRKSDIVDRGHDNRGHHDVGSNESKRNYTTQTQEKISQRIYTDGAKRLEVIKPRRDENRSQSNSNKNESYHIGKNRQESQSVQNTTILRSDNQRSFDNLGKEGLSEPAYKAHQYSSYQKSSERSRSRSRDKSRHSLSNHNNPDYHYSNQSQRRSRSRSFSRDHLDIQKKLHNGFNSNHKNYPIHHLDSSYSHSKDPYYDRRSPYRYRELDRRSRSRSRSSHRRGYSPHRDYMDRRDGPGYDYYRKRTPTRSRSRERSKSRGSYHRSHYRSSRSRSPGRGCLSLNIERSRNYEPRKMIGGLVIEKRDFNHKYPHNDDRSSRDKYRGDFDYAKDRYSSHRRSSRSRERERNYQNDWRHPLDYRYSKSPDSTLSRKGLEKKSEMVIEKNSQQSKGSRSNYGHENRDKTLNKEIQQKNTDQNSQYGNMTAFSSQSAYQNTYSNMSEQNLSLQNQTYDQYLPSYLSSITRQNPVDVPLINNPEPFVFSEPVQNQLLQTQNNQSQLGMQSFEGQEKEYLPSKGIDEENETHNAEISLTDNTNDTVKTEEKVSPEKRELGGLDQENEPNNNNDNNENKDNNQNDSNHPLVGELIKNKKMQGIINYLVTTGDVQGLKEKLIALEKLK